MYVAFPKNPQITRREWWHKSSQPLPVKFKGGREFQIAAHIAQKKGKGGYAVLLYPRRRYEIQPTYTSNADGTAVAVTIGKRHDVIFCAKKKAKRIFAGVTCDGTVAIIKQSPAYTAITLPEPGQVSFDDITVTTPSPLSLRFTDKQVLLQTHKPKEQFTISFGKKRAGIPVILNGKTVGKLDANGKFRSP